MELLFIGLAVAIVCGFAGSYVAAQKERPPAEGWWLGFGLGPLGLIVAALLPTKEAPKRKPARRLSRSGWQPPKDDGWEDEAANWLRTPERN